MTPISDLKTAIRTALLADGALTAALGGAKVFDDVPRDAAAPYIVFGDAIARENGTASDRGHFTEMTLHCWSKQGGSREALTIADRMGAALDDVLWPLAGHRMVVSRVIATETRRTPEKDLTRVSVRLRIITEVL